MHGWRSEASGVGGRLRRRRGLLLAVAATLGLGLGAATTLLAVRVAVLDTPLPYDVDGRLMLVWNRWLDAGYDRLPLSDAEWRDHKRALRSAGLADRASAFVLETATLLGSGEPRSLSVVRAEPDLLEVLGLEAGLKRPDAYPGDEVCVVSHRAWRDVFASDPALVGRRIDLGGISRRVIAVLPESASFPPPITWQGRTTGDGRGADVFLPLETDWKRPRSDRRLMAVVRMTLEAELGETRRELKTSAFRLVESYPKEHPPGLTTWAVSLHGQSLESALPTLRTLTLAVALVLLVACVNVSLLLLARAVERRGEVAIRAALGARRVHWVTSALMESLRLAAAAGLGALATAWVACSVIRRVELPGLPGLARVQLDSGIVLTALALAVLCGMATGLAPTWRAFRGEFSSDLKGARQTAGGSRLRGVQSALVVAELAMAVVLLAVSAVLVQDFLHLLDADPGFRHAGVAHLDLRLDPTRADGDEVARLLESVRGLPEVGQAAAATAPPLSAGLDASAYHVDFGGLIVTSGADLAVVERVTPDYFDVLGIPAQAGDLVLAQALPSNPSETRGAVVSMGLARRVVGRSGMDPTSIVGARLTLDDPRSPEATWLTIRGVSGHVHDGAVAVYLPMPLGEPALERLSILAAGQPGASIPAHSLREAIWAVDPTLPVEIEALSDRVEVALQQPRLAAILLGSFALLVAFLGAVGVHGVLTFQVARRSHEVALRQALGATLRDIRALVLRQAVHWAIWGAGVGLLLSWLIGRTLRSLVPGFQFEVGHLGLLTAAALLVLPLAWMSAWLPSHRAARVDPVRGLRVDG